MRRGTGAITRAATVAVLLVLTVAGCTSGPDDADGPVRARRDAPTSAAGLPAPVWTRGLWQSGTSMVGDQSWLAVTDHTVGAGRGSTYVVGPLHRFEADTGRRAWARRPLRDHWICARSPRYGAEGPIGFVHATGDRGDCTWIAGVDSRTGRVTWQQEVSVPVDLVHTSGDVVVAGVGGTLGTPHRVVACVDRATGRGLDLTDRACVTAADQVVGPRLVRADGTDVEPNDFVELGRHDGVRIGWLQTESELVLLAFDEESGDELWRRTRIEGEQVFADHLGVVRAVPQAPLHELDPEVEVTLTLTRVDPRTWETVAELGDLSDARYADQVGGLSVFVTDASLGVNATMSAYDLPAG